MSTLIDLLALAAALACGWVVVSHLSRMVFKRGSWALDWPALTLPLYGGACVACLAAAGIIGAVPGILISVALLGTVAVLLGDSWVKARRLPDGGATRRILGALASQARGGCAYIREDALAALGLLRREPQQDAPQAPAPTVGSGPRRTVPAPRAAPDPGTTGVPPVREDPALGDPGQPEDIADDLAASGIAVPAHWAVLADRIAAFDPADEDELRDEIAGDAAGALLVAEAIRARADTLLTVTGLDPAYVAGHADFADEFAGMAQAAALVHRRFYVIYNAIRDFVSGGGILPHRAREFFGGGDGGAPAGDGQGEADAA